MDPRLDTDPHGRTVGLNWQQHGGIPSPWRPPMDSEGVPLKERPREKGSFRFDDVSPSTRRAPKKAKATPKRNGPNPAPREHGTEKGYQQHKHRQEVRCVACLDAHSAYQRAVKAREKKEAA